MLPTIVKAKIYIKIKERKLNLQHIRTDNPQETVSNELQLRMFQLPTVKAWILEFMLLSNGKKEYQT